MKPFITITLSLFVASVLSAQVELPNTISTNDKIYGLSKFWQEVNYNFVYLHKIDRGQWEKDYKQLIGEVQQTENDYEYYRLLQRFCASLKDGHTNVYFPPSTDSLIYTTYFGDYRLFLEEIDGKAIVVRTNYSKKEEIPVGTEIIAVNGLPTGEYADQYVKPYIASSTSHVLEKVSISQLLSSPRGTDYRLTFKTPDGEVFERQLTHEDVSEKAVYPPYEIRSLLDFKWLEEGIAYIALNSFSDPRIDSLFVERLPDLQKAQKLIIDLRYNGGGNTSIGTEILKYLTYDRKLYGSAYQSRLHIPAFKAWGRWVEPKDTLNGTASDMQWNRQALLSHHDNYFHHFPYAPTRNRVPQKRRIVVPTVLLIGSNTASAAEDFLIAADNQEHMTKIGQPTYGSTGQPLFFELPGGGSARVCTKKDTYPDGRAFVGVGVLPDIEIRKTVEDFISGNDPAMEAAIEYLKRQP